MELLKLASFTCPYCGEGMDVEVDCSIPDQSYIEDCEVCCRPISMIVSVDDDYEAHVSVQHENES